MTVFGDNLIHRVVKDRDKEIILYDHRDRYSSEVFLDVFNSGKMRTIKFLKFFDFLKNQLGIILGIVGITIIVLLCTVWWNINGLLAMGLLLVSLLMVFIAILDFVSRFEYGETFFEEKIALDHNSFLSQKICVVKESYYVDFNSYLDYLNELSDDDLVKLAHSFEKWKKVDELYDKLKSQINTMNSGSVDEDIVDFSRSKLKELEIQVSKNNAERSKFNEDVKKSSEQSSLLKTVIEVEKALND